MMIINRARETEREGETIGRHVETRGKRRTEREQNNGMERAGMLKHKLLGYISRYWFRVVSQAQIVDVESR